MSQKFEKLLQQLESVEKFVAAKSNQEPDFEIVAEELKQLTNVLKVGKNRVNIVSRFPVLTAALEKLINSQSSLSSIYDLKTITPPTQPQPNLPNLSTSLTLQPSVTTGEKPTPYQLSNQQKVTIGRQENCQISLSHECTLVSRNHLEIIPILENSQNLVWEIRDLNSTYGTYINGEKLVGSNQKLNPGDRITLGSPQHTFRSPEFRFECESKAAVIQEPKLEINFNNCEILCLVINPSQPLDEQDKQLIEAAVKTQLFKLVIVWDTSAENLASPLVKNNIYIAETWLKSYNFRGEYLVQTYLQLPPFHHYSQEQSLTQILTLNSQSDYTKFYQIWETLVNGDYQEILKEQVKAKMILQLGKLDEIFNKKEAFLKQEIQKNNAGLAGQSIEDFQEQINRVSQQIHSDISQTMLQIRNLEIPSAKANLIEAHSQNSLLFKIKNFIDNLQITIKKNGEQYEIHLHSEQMRENDTIHSYINRLCISELSNWSYQEWQKILYTYANGGLMGFAQRAYTNLSFIPSFELSISTLTITQQNFDVYKCWQESYVEFTPDIPPEQKTNYLIEIGRFGAGAMGITLGNPFPLITSLINVFDKNSAKQFRQEQQIEPLKNKLCDYYQSIGKSMVEKLMIHLNYTIQMEENRLSKNIQIKVNEMISHLAKAKKLREEYQVKLQNLQKEKIEINQRIKGEVS
ncbi:MAG: FHA domain-containing protein [Okeania sp. SIO2D1]|nr:FHA domain-containing protein [Okeania sp. SIO2D1]